jgi:GH43 family beta-xylosidase
MMSATYRNPVWPHSFPDPFVLKHRGEYWAYCTGFWHDGRCFGILRSRDLVSWEPQAGAMQPLPGDHPCYWAPEVTYDVGDGRFYLYYSVGNEERMEIRAAVADHPAGPFADSGRRLTSEPFAIDAHVFAAADGTRWLFYATDFLEHSHIGTGTVRDRLLDPFTLAGDPRPVTLPRHDWHLYHPRRPEKGNVRWHTVEGPFVLERKGVLYQMLSGGNWQNPTYGVSYATARDVADPAEWAQAADGERVLPILRTVRGPAGDVIGPGHNSVVRGPDNRELFCVYHRWSDGESARVMAIDRLDWAGERMLILGPTTTPQPAPSRPAAADLADPAVLLPTGSPSFLVEVSVRTEGGAGFSLRGADGSPFQVPLQSLHPVAFHLLRLEVDGVRASLAVDGAPRWRGRLPRPAAAVALAAERTAAEFSGFALTLGWEELFLEDGDAAGLGWEVAGGEARVSGGRLRLLPGAGIVRIARGPAFAHSTLTVNARLDEETESSVGGYRIFPAGEEGSQVALERPSGRWVLAVRDREGSRVLPLPEAYDPRIDQQLRFRRDGEKIDIAWEGLALGSAAAPAGSSSHAGIALEAEGAAVSFEAVRLTAEE